MKKFLMDHPVITLLIVWALGDVASNMYANKCRLEALKIKISNHTYFSPYSEGVCESVFGKHAA